MVLDLGFYRGTDLNRAHDNLWFTLLFKRPEWYAKERGVTRAGYTWRSGCSRGR
jgi:hypothetical protein